MTTSLPSEPARRVAERPSPAGAAPARAEGLELLGRFEDSGFKSPPYLVRRADGQVVQLTPILYATAEAADGLRDFEAIADAVTARAGRRVTPDNVRVLVERKLRPLGVLAAADGSSPPLQKRDAVLALRHRRALVPASAVRRLAAVGAPAFWPPLLIAAVAGVLAVVGWLVFDHGLGGALRGAIHDPPLLLAVFGAVILATAFHEIGHASACRYGGARPGAMGAGLYLIWPAFYCDVTDSYRLGRWGRVRTDLGGVFFNGLFILAVAAAYTATGVEALLLLVMAQLFVIVQQLLPLLRFDGYYVLSDLTGVPDILSRVGSILHSLLPWRSTPPAVDELKPWVRVVVGLYVGILIPVAVLLIAWMVIAAPRVLATVADSLVLHAERASAAARGGDVPAAVLDGLQAAMLALPVATITMSLTRIARLLVAGARRWTAGSTRRRAVALAAAAVSGGFAVAALWPDGDYRPIAPAERGTLGEAVTGRTTSFVLGTAAPVGVPAEGESGITPAQPGAAAPEAGAVAPSGEEQPAGEDGARATDPAAHEDEATPGEAEPEGAATPGPAADPTATPSPVAADPAATATPEALGQPDYGDDPVNRAEAINTTDGSRLFQLAFDLQRVRGDTVDQMNIARAIASCEACRTIAIAVQVVLVVSDVRQAVPVNLAEAVNYACPACETLAFAYQLVLSTGGEVAFTQEALARIAAIEAALGALETSGASVLEIRAAADRLVQELREVIVTGIRPVAGAPPPTEEEAPSSAQPDSAGEVAPAPTATPAPTVTAAPTPAPTTAAEATPVPTAEPTVTAEPTATATP